MTVEDENIRSLLSGWGLAAKPCDSCNLSPSVLFCRNHSAFLCSPCDADIHQGHHHHHHHHQPHERVWICEVCEQAPAAFTCKADAASLCVSCDRDIHSANPLSRRHHRDPVVPFLYSPAAKHAPPLTNDTDHSWLIPNHNSVLFDHLDPCLDFGDDNGIKNPPPDSSYCLTTTTPGFEIGHQQHEYENKAKVAAAASVHDASHQHHQFEQEMMMIMSHQYRNVSDGVVPTVTTPRSMDDSNNNNNSNNSPSMNYDPFMTNFTSMQKKKVKNSSTTTNTTSKDCFEIDFTQPELSPVFYASSQSLSVSSSDTGVVPDGGASNNSMSEVSNNPLFSKPVPAAAVPLSKAEREARVMRYREKRKNRKFEKTIRYASRKAYAESRPRNKGRFAKRIADPDDEDGVGIYGVTRDGGNGGGFLVVDHCGYSVVPTF